MEPQTSLPIKKTSRKASLLLALALAASANSPAQDPLSTPQSAAPVAQAPASRPAAPSNEWRFVPPEGSGVVNVKDYGAKGDGVTDDTEAIARAISENIDKHRYRSNPFIWFPDGTYLISSPIEGRIIEEGREEGKIFSAGWRSMIGETRDGTVIKLMDNTPGYDNPDKPKWVLATGSEDDNCKNFIGCGNRAFRHIIRNLTVDVGAGNPGAIGIDFIANNRGTTIERQL